MAKFTGLVGYVTQEEKVLGVWSPVETTKTMRGDIINQSSNNQNDDKVNSDVTLGHRVSLLGDAYAFDNYFSLKWIELNGHKWEVASVVLQRPRIIATLGGSWNAK